jgi:ribosomal protein S18 acetylase RimI-like enzyme
MEKLETNEFEFWSYWADSHTCHEKLFLIKSSYFREFFFNRAFFLDCEIKSKMKYVYPFYSSDFCISLPDDCSEKPRLKKLDRMFVLKMENPEGGNFNSALINNSIEDWCYVYLLSFYGSVELMDGTVRSVRKAVSSGRTELLGYFKDGKLLGVSALYNTEGIVGMYCIGTLKEYRRRGIASDMIRHASKIARERNKELILQTLESDSLLSFYLSKGFYLAYTKTLYIVEGGNKIGAED